MPIREVAWPQGTPCWVDCQVDDPVKARAFYSGLFGWQVEDGPAEAGGYLIAMKDGRPAAGIGPKPNGPAPSAWTTYFATDNVGTAAAGITLAGGTVVMAPLDVLDVGRMAIAVDPAGATFGIWQAKSHIGAQIFNEPGAYCWNELHTRAYTQAQQFYHQVFDWTYTPVEDTADVGYSTFTLPGAQEPVGGINDDTRLSGDAPAHWLTWFQVHNTDTALTRAAVLGATITMGATDSPFGRMGVLTGLQGEVFGVIDPTTTISPT